MALLEKGIGGSNDSPFFSRYCGSCNYPDIGRMVYMKYLLFIITLLIAGLTFLYFRENEFLVKLQNLISPKSENQVLPFTTVKIKTTEVVPSPTKTVVKKNLTPTKTPINTDPWGVSKQIGEHTWTIRVGEDATMTTAKEVFEAINEYRRAKGSQVLTWNDNLANYAQTRADYLNSIKLVDGHKGFDDYVKNQDGFNKLGFNSLGENISYGYKVSGVHLIEWVYAGDEPHDKNQLDNKWNFVGIGIKGLATCLIFGTAKI
jgi:uncharacterized protein YkwD